MTQQDGQPEGTPDSAWAEPTGPTNGPTSEPMTGPMSGPGGADPYAAPAGDPHGQGQAFGPGAAPNYGGYPNYGPYSGYQPGYQPGYQSGQPGYQPAQPGQPDYQSGFYVGPTVYGPYGPYLAPPPPPPAAAPRRRLVPALIAGLVAAVAVAAVAIGVDIAHNPSTSPSASVQQPQLGTGNGGTSNGGTSNGGANSGNGGFIPVPMPNVPGFQIPGQAIPGQGVPGQGNGGTNSGSVGHASSTQQVGVVDIYTDQKYDGAEAAGTGMILTSTGEVLTNNHVIRDSTSIRVTVVATGKSYDATLVGTAPTKDIAVIQLQGASGLTPVNLGESSGVQVGDSVTGVGNAGGVGGTPSAAKGKVLALNRTITASDEDNTNAERLHGVIVTSAPIQPGDSGGPLYDSSDKVVGIDTAANTSGASQGFSIPIDTALTVAKQIETGVQTSSIHIGYPGFLAITMSPSTTRPLIYQVLQGGPAAKAGLVGGDLITQVDGKSVTTQTQLRNVISVKDPGTKVAITYRSQTGATHSVPITLTTGPAD